MRNDWAGDRGFVEHSERQFREDPDGHGRKTSQALIALTNLEQARAGLQIRLDTKFQSSHGTAWAPGVGL